MAGKIFMKTFTLNRSSRISHFIGVLLTVALLLPSAVFSQYANPSAVSLLTAGTYGALGSSGVFGSANVNGDVGTITGTIDASILQLGTSWGVAGAHNADAQTDLTSALSDISGRVSDETITLNVLGGLTLERGIYSGGALDLASGTTLTLNGSATDIFIFKAASTITINTNSTIALTGGAVWTNVFWYVGSSATLFSGSTFNGVILANVSITVNAGAALVTSKLLANTGAITMNSDVLPVELVSFAATADQMNTELNWTTATEVNNFGFEVERTEVRSQKPEVKWSKVGFVEGNGTTNAPKEYSFTDMNLGSGNYSYRLKQIDRDGKFEYSQSVEITIGTTPTEFALLQNYPNPFNPSTLISYQLPSNSLVSLKVYDAIGREMATLVNEVKEAGSYSVQFNASHLSSGIYFYTINAGKFTETKKLTLMK